MTTEQTAKAATDAKPNEGDILMYIDFEGKKLFAQPDAQPTKKPKGKTE